MKLAQFSSTLEALILAKGRGNDLGWCVGKSEYQMQWYLVIDMISGLLPKYESGIISKQIKPGMKTKWSRCHNDSGTMFPAARVPAQVL